MSESQAGRIPNTFIAGAPKAGTSSLFSYMVQHPDVAKPRRKEPHHYCYAGEGLPPWGIQTFEEYQVIYANVPPEPSILIDGSTWHLYSQTAARMIRERVPEARIIAMLRHPADRAYSSFQFRVMGGFEPILDFRKALAAEPERIRQGKHWDFRYMDAGRYAGQLERFLDVFGREHVLVLRQEELKNSAIETCQRVCRFLEIDDTFVPDVEKQHNVTRYPRNPIVHHLLGRQGKLRRFAKRVVPTALRSQLVGIQQRNLSKPPRLDPELRAELTRQEMPEIERLEELLGWDLTDWKEATAPR